MSREAVSTNTLIKGLAACAVVACSMGSLYYTEYPQKPAGITQSAQAQGMESMVTVTVTVDGSTITDVQLDVSGETAGLGADIGDELTAQILEAQSAQIDGVAGCTVTSTAVKTALEEALAGAVK